jgi:pyruvate,water dikinase
VETKTLAANRALEALAAQIRADPLLAAAFARESAGDLPAALARAPAGRAFLNDLDRFLDQYGHREAVISTALLPTWKDAPETVLGLLKGLAGAAPRPEPARPAWQVARDGVLAHPLLQLPPARSLFLTLLAEARCFDRIREDTHFDATLALPIVRRAALELGRRLVAAGVLDAPEDVFHLRLAELEATGEPPSPALVRELRALVVRRKAKRAAVEATPLIDTRLAPSARRTIGAADVLLRGSSGSRGVAEGPVCVVRDPSEFGKLQGGNVLVAPFTNPAWTPLFQRAAAVVVDSGGAGSHAAIVAREYGIPAVMGTVDGSRRLADGQRVRVDGDRGIVAFLNDHAGDGSSGSRCRRGSGRSDAVPWKGPNDANAG